MEPTPTADLDRSNDKVYDCTTGVVKAVMSLSQGKLYFLFAAVYCTVVTLFTTLYPPSSFDVDIKYNITIKVCVSSILLGGNFVLMAYFSTQSIAVYTCTLDIADLSEEEVNDVTS